MTTDAHYASQWNLDRINIETAWAISHGEGVTIAVLDGGVHNHPDLTANLLPGWCVITNSATFDVVDDHGTSCAGVLAAVTDNGIGIAGVARSAKILPIRVRNGASTAQANVALGLLKARDMGARVASISIAVGSLIDDLRDAVIAFERAGGVVVAGMRNIAGESSDDNFPPIIMVGATNDTNNVVFQYGSNMDIVAPATNLYSTTATGDPLVYGYGVVAGNSYSAPTVAGVAALILSLRPELGAADVREILYQSANDTINAGWTPGWDKYKGYGLLDAGAALALAQTWEPLGWRYPEVAIISPAPGVLPAGASAITAYAADDNAVAQVDLLVDGVVEDTIIVAPYAFTWIPPAAGQYSLTVRATDDQGQQTTTSPLLVTALGIHTTLTSTLDLAGLAPCKSYDVRVRGVNGGGAGPWSEWETQALPCQVPATPPIADAQFVYRSKITVGYLQGAWATGHQYRLDGGLWASASNPLIIPLTMAEQVLDLRAITGAGNGATLTVTLPVGDIAARYASPIGDVSKGNWSPLTGSLLYPAVDETVANDADYIYTDSESHCELALRAVADPGTSSGQVVRIRAKSSASSILIARLKQGSTTIATRTFSNVATDWTVYEMSLSGAECDAITDYSALSVSLEAQ